MSKVSWNDLFSATFKELKKTYKLSDRALEQAVGKHLDGANASEKRQMYHTVWDKRDK
ncbi:MAG TPA: hypothetical protein VGJ00_10240 [Rhabdochlamydiaceae bacterium]|jgi:hypothetical protein